VESVRRTNGQRSPTTLEAKVPDSELSFQSGTAESHIVTNIPRANANERAEAVISSLCDRTFECADTIFVTDSSGHLNGIVRINDLFSDSSRLLGEIMETKYESVRASDDQEQIALVALRLNMIAVPVVDDNNCLIGAVPPEALFKILRAEHMEDLQRVAGITATDRDSEIALGAPVLDRYRRRLPWLIFGLFASGLITMVMAEFEHTLSANISVAFFIPALVYIAGAIGTQAVSVAVQGLSIAEIPIRTLIRDELFIGMAIGASLGFVSFVMVLFSLEQYRLALAVGLAVFTGGTISAVVGFGLPWLFKRFGSDPALGSGPICTIIQDLSALSAYFLLVGILLS